MKTHGGTSRGLTQPRRRGPQFDELTRKSEQRDERYCNQDAAQVVDLRHQVGILERNLSASRAEHASLNAHPLWAAWCRRITDDFARPWCAEEAIVKSLSPETLDQVADRWTVVMNRVNRQIGRYPDRLYLELTELIHRKRQRIPS
ncbi:hypothetical protein [Caballeronia glathei]|uniref:hypothetical protein n=1 Tax=Caballeronia glathei TaxID=60547 RepID=UPI00055D7577|nr:hypothetical protein [Caballeronia glathei]